MDKPATTVKRGKLGELGSTAAKRLVDGGLSVQKGGAWDDASRLYETAKTMAAAARDTDTEKAASTDWRRDSSSCAPRFLPERKW